MTISTPLTPKRLGHFFKNVILFRNFVHHKCDIFIWNWSNTMNVESALWILMAWCFSTRASVATVLTTHPCISQCLRVKLRENGSHFAHSIFKYIFRNENLLKFHWNVFLRVQLIKIQHWFRWLIGSASQILFVCSWDYKLGQLPYTVLKHPIPSWVQQL